MRDVFRVLKPHIVILSAFATPLRSGAEACSEEVSGALKDRFDFTIVTAKMRPGLPRKDMLPNGVPLVRLGLGCVVDKWLFPFLAPFAVRRLKPDIIHAVLESFAGLALVLCKWIVPSAKRVLTCQSTNTSLLLRPMHRVADRVTVISSVLRERAWHFGRTDAKLIANGVHVDLLHAACERTAKVPGRILFVGRLEPMKGVDTLLRAFAQWKMENGIWKVGPSIHLRIVGDGSERGRLERLAKELNIMERVTFVGFVPVPAVYDEFAAAELFAGLSRSEALGNVFLEAQAAACPVVATNVGGIPDVVVDGQSGILIPPNDPQRAASSMLRILEQDTLRRSMAAAGTEKASQYEWSAIAKQYAAVYEALLRLERTSVVAR